MFLYFRKSSSRSRSRSPINTGQITFITSFGHDSDEEAGGVATSAAPLIVQGPTLPPHLAVQSDKSPRSVSPCIYDSFSVLAQNFFLEDGLYRLLIAFISELSAIKIATIF